MYIWVGHETGIQGDNKNGNLSNKVIYLHCAWLQTRKSKSATYTCKEVSPESIATLPVIWFSLHYSHTAYSKSDK